MNKIDYYQRSLYDCLTCIEAMEPNYFVEFPSVEERTIDIIDSRNTMRMLFQLNKLNKTIDALQTKRGVPMKKATRIFDTFAEAEAFVEGVQYVNDSAITVRKPFIDKRTGLAVVLLTDMDEMEE